MRFEQPPAEQPPAEQSPRPSPEDMAKIGEQKEISDAEFLKEKDGTDYKFDEKGEKILDATGEQIEGAKKEGPKINFPEDINIVKALQKKLTEYKERLDSQMEKYPFKAPELFMDTNYKIAVLERLLITGEVNTHELSRELIEKFGGFDAKIFNNACAVIEDYAKTGGKEVIGGTGLKFEKGKQKANEIETIENADDFDNLFKAIEATGGLQGSSTLYKPEVLKNIINKVRNGELDLTYITRTGGLRSKVEELLAKNKESK